MQASGKTPKAPKAKAPAKPATAIGGKGASKAKDGSTNQAADAAAQREEEATLLAAVQSVRSGAASDAAGAKDRLKVAREGSQSCTHADICWRALSHCTNVISTQHPSFGSCCESCCDADRHS